MFHHHLDLRSTAHRLDKWQNLLWCSYSFGEDALGKSGVHSTAARGIQIMALMLPALGMQERRSKRKARQYTFICYVFDCAVITHNAVYYIQNNNIMREHVNCNQAITGGRLGTYE